MPGKAASKHRALTTAVFSEEAASPHYIMESEREGARLEGKTDAAEAERQLRTVGLVTGMCVLDVGCGSGAVARVMAQIAAPGRVVGLDDSEQRVALAARLAENAGIAAEFLAHNAARMPFADGEFDFAWSRFLFEYLPDRRAVLAEMRRVTRPGGVVVVADLDGQLSSFYPLEPSLAAEWEAGLALIRRGGFDPEVGRKLYGDFLAAGLEQVSVTVQPHQVYAGGLPERDRANWTEKFTTACARLSAATGEDLRWTKLRDRMLSRLAEPDLFYYSTLVTVRGVVPRH